MNIQLTTKFFLGNPTILTSVFVTKSGVSTLLSPVRTVIGLISSAPIIVVFTGAILTLMFGKALARAKLSIHPFLTFNLVTALNAKHWTEFNNSQLPSNVCSRGAFSRTILAWPTVVIPEFFAALWTCGIRARGFFLTLARAMDFDPSLIRGGIKTERSFAIGAFSGN
jgi:hypothetical protein